MRRTYRRLLIAGVFAAAVAFATARETTTVAGPAVGGSLLAVVAGGTVLVGVFVAMAKAMGVTELDAAAGLMRARLNR